MTTYSQGLRLSEPTPGDPAVANIWGTILNTNFTLIDTSVTGTLVLDVSGGANIILTANNGNPDQSRNANFVFPGTLTGNIDVLFPEGGAGSFSVQNTTTGAFSLSVAVNNGSGAPEGLAVIVPQGGTLDLVSNGTDVRKRVDLVGLGGAASGANSDITSLTGLTTPLPITEGGTGAVTGAAALAALGYVPVGAQTQIFTASGTFTVPATATAATVFKFTVIGGGGGGGGSASGPDSGGFGGASGGAIKANFSGFTAGQPATIAVGSGGGGGSPGGNGSVGGTSSVSYAAASVVSANGGAAGFYGISATKMPAPGTTTANSGGGLTLLGSYGGGAQYGGGKTGNQMGGNGGGNSVGTGGGSSSNGGAVAGDAGTFGGGGGGGVEGGAGGAGGNGIVIVEWVL